MIRIVRNQIENNMEHEISTGFEQGFYWEFNAEPR